MFQGNFSNTLDDKGRVAIPARFRDALAASGDDKLMMTIFELSGVPCLEAYSYQTWQELNSALQATRGSFSQNRLLFETVYIGSVQQCQPDKQGRVLIPQTQRTYAELDGDVTFVGAGKKFQIFSASGHAKVVGAFRSLLRENPDFFHDLGI